MENNTQVPLLVILNIKTVQNIILANVSTKHNGIATLLHDNYMIRIYAIQISNKTLEKVSRSLYPFQNG